MIIASPKLTRPVRIAWNEAREGGEGSAKGECEAKSCGDLKAVTKLKSSGITMMNAARDSPA